MAIGPTFECTASLLQQLPLLAASHNIRMEILDAQESDALAVYCVFKGPCGGVEDHLNSRGQTPRMWLNFPRAYALNPPALATQFPSDPQSRENPSNQQRETLRLGDLHPRLLGF